MFPSKNLVSLVDYLSRAVKLRIFIALIPSLRGCAALWARRGWPQRSSFAQRRAHLCFCSAGAQDGHVLSTDKAGRQPHPVHPEQREAAGAGEGQQGGGGEGEEQGGHGLLPGEPGGVFDVWFLTEPAEPSHVTPTLLWVWHDRGTWRWCWRVVASPPGQGVHGEGT